jgi:hypothetical protein
MADKLAASNERIAKENSASNRAMMKETYRPVDLGIGTPKGGGIVQDNSASVTTPVTKAGKVPVTKAIDQTPAKQQTADWDLQSEIDEASEGFETNTGNTDKIFASGKYQVIPKTLKTARDAGIIKDGDIWNKDTQEKVGEWLIGKRADGYLKGNGSLEEAALGLAKEWRGLATSDGTTYGGSGGPNKAHVTYEQVLSALRTAKGTGNYEPIKKLITGAESGGDYGIYNQGTNSSGIISSTKKGRRDVQKMDIKDIIGG